MKPSARSSDLAGNVGKVTPSVRYSVFGGFRFLTPTLHQENDVIHHDSVHQALTNIVNKQFVFVVDKL